MTYHENTFVIVTLFIHYSYIHFAHFLNDLFLIYIFGRLSKGDKRKDEKSSIYCFTLQMGAMAGIGLRLKPGAWNSIWISMWVSRTQVSQGSPLFYMIQIRPHFPSLVFIVSLQYFKINQKDLDPELDLSLSFSLIYFERSERGKYRR